MEKLNELEMMIAFLYKKILESTESTHTYGKSLESLFEELKQKSKSEGYL